MEISTISVSAAAEDEENKNRNDEEDSLDSSSCIKSWPVPLPIPVKSLYVKGTRRIRRKPYRFKYSSMKNWLVPLDGPMSMDHIHFLLDCFVVSAGPGPLQLGRYHPQSDPEAFVQKEEPEDNWSLTSGDESQFWAKVGVSTLKEAMRDPGTSSLITEWPGGFDDYLSQRPSNTVNRNAPPRPTYTSSEFMTPDDVIARELSEMRLVLERLLDNHDLTDWEHPHEIRNILELLPEDISPKEPSPHYPVGEWEFDVCGICFDAQWLYRRACCQFPACSPCLQKYFSSKIEEGQVKIECCNTSCNSYVHRDEISAKLSIADKEKFHKLLVLANQDSHTKTCPRCSHVTKIANKPKIADQRFPW